MAILTRQTANSPIFNGSTTTMQFDRSLYQAASNANTQLVFDEAGDYQLTIRRTPSLLPHVVTDVATFTDNPTTTERLFNTPVFENNQWSLMGQSLGGQYSNIYESYLKPSAFMPKSDLRSHPTYVGKPTTTERVMAMMEATKANMARKGSTGIYVGENSNVLNGGALNSLVGYKGTGLPGRAESRGGMVTGGIIGYDKNTGYAIGLDRGADARTYNVNSLFSLAQGTGGERSPFSNTRWNMGGQFEVIGINDPRHTSTAYAARYPELYNQFQAGQLTGSQLFSKAMSYSVQNDTDEMNTDIYKVGNLPKINITFSKSGGGSIKGSFTQSF